MTQPWQVIHLHAKAPAKPAIGAPCNGCGACCASEPCPLGIVLSGRRHGACSALRWDAAQARYLCGAVSSPEKVLPAWLAAFSPLLARLARRWISAGSGCDAALSVSAADPQRPR